MIPQASRYSEPRRIRDQRVRDLPLWIETTRRARLSDWVAGLFVVAVFTIGVVA